MRNLGDVENGKAISGFALFSLKALRNSKGLTILEMMVSLVIVSILLGLFFSLGSHFVARASDAGCKSNLRTIHAGLTSYMAEHQMVWPQPPDSVQDDRDDGSDKEAEWWYETLKNHDVQKKNWICPGDSERKRLLDSEHVHISTYSITPFDDVPNNAYRWKQPWVIEDGDLHGRGKGPNMIFPDGSITKGFSLMPPE